MYLNLKNLSSILDNILSKKITQQNGQNYTSSDTKEKSAINLPKNIIHSMNSIKILKKWELESTICCVVIKSV